ncbi:MAG: class I SAM-dependent methyltransferase [Gaiellaceae bacterium]
MSRIDDPAGVREQYAREDNLRARQALYEESEGTQPHDVLRDGLRELAPESVLEVGGGPGELAEWMRDELGARVSFLDLSPRMVELARGRGLDAAVGDVQQLPFPDRSFDVVVAAWMLYHVPDLPRGLSELARVLVPGGALVAATNSVTHLQELRALLRYPEGEGESFNRENGAALLAPHFARVERRDAEVTVTVRNRQKLVDYRDSMQVTVAEVPRHVELPFIVHARTTVFVATK